MSKLRISQLGLRCLALLAGLVAVPTAPAQNLNRQYGSGWSCEMLLPTRYFCESSVGGRLGAYGDKCILYDACMKCERAGQDFVKTSGTGGHCQARGSVGAESGAKPRRSESRPREMAADRAERQLDRDSEENDRLREACLDRALSAVETCNGRCDESNCVRGCDLSHDRQIHHCHEEAAARTERYLKRHEEALALLERESAAKQPSTPRPPTPNSPAAAAPRVPEAAPLAVPPTLVAKPAVVETARTTISGEACRVDPLTAKVEASLTRGDLPRLVELGSAASEMARRRERGCAMGHAKQAANPFAAQAHAAIRQAARVGDDWQHYRADLEPEPPAFAGEARPDPDCLGLSLTFTLSGIGRCLRYLVKNHPAQGQALTLDAIDRALLKELGKEGLYGKP